MEVNDALTIQKVGNEIIVLDKENNQIHQMNSVAAFIWKKLNQAKGKEQITKDLVEYFDVDVDMATQDLNIIIQEFICKGLLFEPEKK